jgi:hypothetical protein
MVVTEEKRAVKAAAGGGENVKDVAEGERSGKSGSFRNEREKISLTPITLTVGVIYTTVFEYRNQVIFNMTVFDGGPSLSY